MFSGHSDYVHCVSLRSGGGILSAAEDGTVKMWGERGRGLGAGHGVMKSVVLFFYGLCFQIRRRLLLYTHGNQPK